MKAKAAAEVVENAAKQVKTVADLVRGRAAWGSIAAGQGKAPAVMGGNLAKQVWNGRGQA